LHVLTDNPLLKTLFGGQIDRKLLEALFSKLLTNSEKDSSDSQPAAAGTRWYRPRVKAASDFFVGCS